MINIKISVEGQEEILRELFGNLDKNVEFIENSFGVKISQDPKGLTIKGESIQAQAVESLVYDLMDIIEREGHLDEQKLRYNVNMVKKGKSPSSDKLYSDIVALTNMGKAIRAKTLGQSVYIQEIRKKDVVFGIGPAGTGKTYLAVAQAVTTFRNKDVSRIILTRPAVEAGESLGFLPGDLNEKIDPYLRPLYDALFEIMGFENYERLMENGQIEVAPLAYMRGRTLDDAFIILDEAQNTTPEQMKMFLTRLGYGSKAVITGDITQVDLPRGKRSGLITVEKILKDIDDIGFIHLSPDDIVRHPLVQKIIDAYEGYEDENESRNK